MKKNSSRKEINAAWLALLKEAMADSNENVRLNNRYMYKGKHLGVFLVGRSQRNNEVLNAEIEKLGFIFSEHRRSNPTKYCKQFIEDIKNTPIENKTVLGIRFFRTIVPKKKSIPKVIIAGINTAWLERYNEERLWYKDSKDDKARKHIEKWKKIRYDAEKNPESKWMRPRPILGGSYHYVYARKTDEKSMHLIQKHFNDTELLELEAEGFPIKKD